MLQARVGENDSFAITLADASGAEVTHLDPGDYTIHVNDMSDMHNFDLTGPGVSKSTDVTDIGEQTWNVTFTNGTYKFVCDVHATTMKGQFTVGVVPTAPPAQKLSGGVGPGAHISLDALRESRQGRADDPRPLEEGQPAPHRPGREQEDGHCVHGHGVVDGDAEAGQPTRSARMRTRHSRERSKSPESAILSAFLERCSHAATRESGAGRGRTAARSLVRVERGRLA